MPHVRIEQIADYVRDEVHAFRESVRVSYRTTKFSPTELFGTQNPGLLALEMEDGDCITREYVRRTVASKFATKREVAYGRMIQRILQRVALVQTTRRYAGAPSGLDFQLLDDQTIFLVEIKSGPKWANHNATGGLNEVFLSAIRTLERNEPHRLQAIVLCSYGRKAIRVRSLAYRAYTCLEITGQMAWTWLSGNQDLDRQVYEICKEGASDFVKERLALEAHYVQGVYIPEWEVILHLTRSNLDESLSKNYRQTLDVLGQDVVASNSISEEVLLACDSET